MLSKKPNTGSMPCSSWPKEKEMKPCQYTGLPTAKTSSKFLEGILLVLRKAGILGSKKGPSGGYYLLKDRLEINLADVMRLFDGPIALLPCVTYKYYERCEECKDEESCGIEISFCNFGMKRSNCSKKVRSKTSCSENSAYCRIQPTRNNSI